MATQHDEHKPAIVLVHGAWADATGFDAEAPAKRATGSRIRGWLSEAAGAG